MRLFRNPLTVVGLAGMVLFLLLSLVGPHVVPYDAVAQDLSAQLAPPSRAHLLGTDSLGRDILSRVVVGTRYSVPSGFVVVAVALLVGMLVGAVAGFMGGWTDEILMRLTDLFLAFPALILAMAIAGARGPGLFNALLALTVAWWPPYARLMRGQVLTARSSLYVDAARCLGAAPARVLFWHILPNCIAPLVVQGTLDLGSVILTAAGLSFIGFGAQPPAPEWGKMVNDGRMFVMSHWWVPTFPGLAILLCVLCFNLFGDGLRDALDPRSAR